jgi:hypothetical protein
LFAPLADKLSGAERVVVLSEEETVKEVIVREPLNFFSDFSVAIVLETVIVQSAYVPTLKVFKVMVLLPVVAMVVLEEHEPP